jgi:translation initiation factor 1
MTQGSSNSRLVYSTDAGRLCSECNAPVEGCICQEIKRNIIVKGDGVIRLRYEVKGRKGKGVTTISGLPMNTTGLLDFAKELKQKFGTGGSVKDYIIELQGDHREQVSKELGRIGYLVK